MCAAHGRDAVEVTWCLRHMRMNDFRLCVDCGWVCGVCRWIFFWFLERSRSEKRFCHGYTTQSVVTTQILLTIHFTSFSIVSIVSIQYPILPLLSHYPSHVAVLYTAQISKLSLSCVLKRRFQEWYGLVT